MVKKSKKEHTAKQRRRIALRRFSPYLRRVGEIASLWSQIEFQLDFIIWELLQTEQQYSACVTAQLGFSQKLRALKALVAARDQAQQHEELIRALNKFTGDATSTYDLRNRAVHDAWMIGVESKRVSQQTAAIKGNRLNFGLRPASIKELEKAAAAIRVLLNRVRALEWEILGALVPSPHKCVLTHFGRTPPKKQRPGRRANSPERLAVPQKASSE
jgi:hypothetical protein